MWTEGRAVTLRPCSPDCRWTSSGTQESIRLFTQPGRLAVVQLLQLPTTTPGRRPVAESAVVQVLLIGTFTHFGFYSAVSERITFHCSTETIESMVKMGDLSST